MGRRTWGTLAKYSDEQKNGARPGLDKKRLRPGSGQEMGSEGSVSGLSMSKT